MASFIGLSASQIQILYRCSLPLSPPASISSSAHFRKQAPVRRLLVLPLKCSSSGPTQDTESEAETTSAPSFSISLASSNSTYNWRAGLGAIGVVETAYLTYLKLSNSDAFCPPGGGSCGDVLNSDYAVIFGVPLPLVGLVAYGIVKVLSLQLSAKSLPFGISETYGRLQLLGTTTSMAAASAYIFVHTEYKIHSNILLILFNVSSVII